MKKKTPSLSPQSIDANNWYYENRGSIELIHEVRTAGGQYIRTDHIKIPWRKLEASMQRCRKG